MRTVALAPAALALTLVSLAPACGGSTKSSVDGAGSDGGDGSSSSGDSGSGDAGSFCTGDTPRMMINGAEVPLQSTRGKGIILNCCDSAELILATSSYQSLFYLLWRAPAGQSPGAIDLGNPPASFSIELDLGCDPATAPCNTGGAEEHYTSGFQGHISYGNSGSTLSASYCISGAEPKNAPHPLIHSFSIYAPNVISGM